MMKLANRCMSVLLSLVIVCSQLIPAVAITAENTIAIGTAEEFAELAQKCKTDTWSQGKTVMLKNDIDLSGNENCIIPTFGGIFDGGGHTISGVKIDKKGSYLALFRYLQKGGVIRNLNVSGSVTPQGSEKYVGGIAGEVSGKIENCGFGGSVRGETNVGGICGYITDSGILSDCLFEGSVTGNSYTGGICGQSYGIIEGCKNFGNVNTTDTEAEKSIQDIDINVENLRTTENIDTSTDTGGICGFSKGTVRDCENRGNVGYPSVGYNTGGICGRQSGTLTGCANYGTVNGRKDVGGICGQAEPYVLLEYTDDVLTRVDEVLSRIDKIIDGSTLLSDSSVSDSLDKINSRMTDITDSADTISEHAGDYADSVSLAVNDASDRLHKALDSSSPSFDDIRLCGDKLANAAEHFKAGGDYMSAIADSVDDAANSLDDAEEYSNDAATALSSAANRFSRAFDNMSDSVLSLRDGSEKLTEEIRKLSDALKQKEDTAPVLRETHASVQSIQSGISSLSSYLVEISKLLENLKNSGQIAGDVSAVIDNIKSTIEQLKSISAALSGIADGLLILAEDFDIYSLSTAMRLFSKGFSYLSNAVADLRKTMDELRSAFSKLDGTTDNAKSLISELQSGFDEISSGADHLSSAASTLSDAIDEATADEWLKIPSAKDVFGSDFDVFSERVTAMQDEFKGLKDAFTGQKNELKNEVDSLSEELTALSDILSDAYDDRVRADDDGFVEDISNENVYAITRGKVEKCENLGEIFCDVNGGGIVGSMAIEYDFDPEDDIKNSGDKSLKFTYKTKCIVLRCKNEGNISVRKDYCGGIAGRMDLGSIISCENYGNAANTDGNYTGGIAGLSDTAIKNSVAKCDLSGNDYIGGIAGSGSVIENCHTLVNIKEYGECIGAVAGSADRSDLKKNYFVGSSFGAVDDINYTGIAEETDIESFVGFVQSEFNTAVKFTLKFVADEKEVGSLDFEYKSAIPPEKIPKVPEKRGFYGKWSEYNFAEAMYDAVITAEYYRNVELIESELKREDGKSVVLLCGAFDDSAKLSASKSDYEKSIDCVSVSIENVYTEAYTVRYLPLSDKSEIYINTEGEMKKISTKKNGSYLEFETTSPDFTICEMKKSYKNLIIILIIAALLSASAFVLIKKFKKKK